MSASSPLFVISRISAGGTRSQCPSGYANQLACSMTERRSWYENLRGALSSAAATKAAQDPTVNATLAKQGFQPLVMGPAEFDAYYLAERDKWGKVIRDTGMDKN